MKGLDLTERMRLQVAVPVAGAVNRLLNPSGDRLLTYGWVTPVAQTSLQGAVGSGLVFETQATAPSWLATDYITVPAGRWVGAQLRYVSETHSDLNLKARFEFFDADFVLLSSSTQTGALGVAGATYYVAGVQAPVGTVWARLRLDMYRVAGNPTAGDSVTFDRAMVTDAATNPGTAYGFSEPNDWVDILGQSHEITVDNEELNVGELNAVVIDSTLDPAAATELRPGKLVRLQALIPGERASDPEAWESLFEGKLTNAVVTYPRGKTRIVLNAVNAIAHAANQREPRGVQDHPDLAYLMEGKGVPWYFGGAMGGGQPGGDAPVVSYNGNASLVDQIAITRDSFLSLAWCSREGVIRVEGGGSVLQNFRSLVTNGHFDSDLTGWSVLANCTLVRDTSAFATSPASMRMTASSTGTMTSTTDIGIAGIPIVVGDTLTVRGAIRANSTTRTARIDVAWYDDDGTLISVSAGSSVSSISSTWTALLSYHSPPPGARYAALRPTVVSAAAGEIHRWDALRVTGPIVFSDVPAPKSLSYLQDSGLDLDFDTEACINEVNIAFLRYDVVSGQSVEVAYGPYRDEASIQRWGARSATFTIQRETEDPAVIAEFAADILALNANPQRRVKTLAVPVRDLRELAAVTLTDLCDRVGVTYADKFHGLCRVARLRHEIVARRDRHRWVTTYGFEAPNSVAAPTVAPPPPPIIPPEPEPDPEPTWVDISGSVSGSTVARYIVVSGWVYLQIAGTTFSLADATSTTIATGVIPADLRPTTSVYQHAYLGAQHMGSLVVVDNGNLLVHQNTGATRSTLRASAAWPVE